jgi:hypothetical protein
MLKLDRTALTELELKALKYEYSRVKDTRPELANKTFEQFLDYALANGENLQNYITTAVEVILTESANKEVGRAFITATTEQRAQIRQILGLPAEAQ